MADLVIVVLALFSFFVLIPANNLANKILSIWLKIEPKEVDSNKYWGFRIFMIGALYIFFWWLSEVTGLRAWFMGD
jgi:uncharacterized BrkB/YihY/UPF0761 family membrane protein